MGFCYDMRNRLCCDLCGESGGVRRQKCPSGWCQAYAVCKACMPAYRARKADIHEGCAHSSANYHAQQAKRQALIDAGELVLASAVNTDDGMTKVWFKGANGIEVERVMTEAQYGQLWPAHSDPTLKMADARLAS